MPDKYLIPILQKTMSVLDLIADYKEGLTFAEILYNLELPKTTLFRILQTLETNNWLSKKNDRYTIGFMMIHYGLLGLSGRNLRLVSLPFLEELRTKTTETAHLAIPSGNKSMIIEVCDSKKHIKLTSPVGSLLDLHCTAHGKIFLAFRIKENLEEFYKEYHFTSHTDQTIIDVPSLQEEVKKVIKNGYSVDDREYYDNVRCLAAPVWGQDNEVVAAVGITATIQDFPKNKIAEIAGYVTGIARKISREMGSI